MSKILKKNGYHSILRYDPKDDCYYGAIEEFGPESQYQYKERDIEKAIRMFENFVEELSNDVQKNSTQGYIHSIFEVRGSHSIPFYLFFYGIVWLVVFLFFQCALRYFFMETRFFTASLFVLTGIVLWAVINIFISHYFYELFLQIRPYYWFYGKGEEFQQAQQWYEKKAIDTFRLFHKGKPTGLFATICAAIIGGLCFYAMFIRMEGPVFMNPVCNYVFLPIGVMVGMFFCGASIWPMCSFFNAFFIDKSFAFRYSKIRFLNQEDIMTVFEIKKFFIYFSFIATVAYIQLLAGCWLTGILMQTKLALLCFFVGSFFPLCMYFCALQFFKRLVDNVGITHISELDHVIEQNYGNFIDSESGCPESYEKISQAIELKGLYYNSLKSHTTWDIGAILTTGISIVSGIVAIAQVLFGS